MKNNSTAAVITADWVRSVLPKRPPDANKGTFGKVLIVAGSVNYIGAAYLACSGAMRTGAGLVTLATAANLQPILAAKLIETTYLPLNEKSPGNVSSKGIEQLTRELPNYNAILIGSGLGQQPSAITLVKSVLLEGLKLPPTVIDADGLNALSGVPQWWRKLTDNAILTPHPGEMARLAGVTVEQVQADRQSIARKMALKWHKTVVLKGANTVIGQSDGLVKVNKTANPGLATAGTGDVLAGVIAGLLAQGMSLEDAAASGVYLHAEAGEIVKEKIGDTGMIASDLLPALPLEIKRLKEGI